MVFKFDVDESLYIKGLLAFTNPIEIRMTLDQKEFAFIASMEISSKPISNLEKRWIINCISSSIH